MDKLEKKIKNIWNKTRKSSLTMLIAIPLAFGSLFSNKAYAQNTENYTTSSVNQNIQYNTYDKNLPKLRVLIPGINTRGEQMLENAKRTLRYDPECTIIIEEAEGWTIKNNYIKENIITATQKAIEKNKDIIVLVDMDLEHNILTSHLTPKQIADLPVIGTRWFKATDWAGSMVNNVAEVYDSVFREKGVIQGKKECEAHSAGVDAFEHSLVLSNNRMFDQLNLFNGRTTTSELVPQIREDRYSPSQVNLFLTKGELLANPHSVANLNAVIPYAGREFTVYYCDEKPSTNRIQNHSALVDEPQISRSFQVYNSQKPYNINTTVENLKTGYLISKVDESKNIGINLTQTNLENRLGGILLDKDNTYLIDEKGNLKEIKESIFKGRKEKGEISWRFEHKDQEYRAIALPFTKEQPTKKSRHYHNSQQDIIICREDDNIIAIRYIQNNDFFQIIQVAKGKVIKERSKCPIFKIDRVLMTDYPLKTPSETNSANNIM